jgi:hypothetical protein
MSEITKEELLLMLDVQGKNVAQMTIVAEQLKSLAETNKTIVAKLTNGMASDLKSVKNAVCGSENETGILKTVKSIQYNSKKSAMYVGFIAGAVAVSLAVMQFVYWVIHKNEVPKIKSNINIEEIVQPK